MCFFPEQNSQIGTFSNKCIKGPTKIEAYILFQCYGIDLISQWFSDFHCKALFDIGIDFDFLIYFCSLSTTFHKSDHYVPLIDFVGGQLSSMENHQTILTMPGEDNYKLVSNIWRTCGISACMDYIPILS
jgi:hypothetical protein